MLNHGKIAGTAMPGATLPFMELKRPGCGLGGKLEGWVLSDAIVGVTTHFYDKRTFPCTKHLGGCDGCTSYRRRTEWNGYFEVLDKLTRDHVVYAVSQFGVSCCLTLDRPDFVLRGSYAIFQRKGESENGAHRLAFTKEPYPKTLPPAKGVVASLARMWKVTLPTLLKSLGLEEGGEA